MYNYISEDGGVIMINLMDVAPIPNTPVVNNSHVNTIILSIIVAVVVIVCVGLAVALKNRKNERK